MKKLINKIIRKKSDEQSSLRITNDTVAEHREKVLSGGRRFKYPVQYARHHLVRNAIIISIVALILLLVIGWWRLYVAQDTNTFMYRVTRVLPLPVASVDGQDVSYSDYLMKYRSSIHYLEQKEQVSLNTEDGKRQAEFIKEQAMQDSIADAYAVKLAKENKITVSDVELESFLKQQRQSSDGEVSQQTYDAVIKDYYDWSPDEYRLTTRNKLLRQKVAYAIDSDATSITENVAKAVIKSNELEAIVSSTSAINGIKPTYGKSGWVPRLNQDGGLSLAALKLKTGQVSDAIKPSTGDGYYFVKLTGLNDTQVNYEYIQVPLTRFDSSLKSIEKADKIHKYINISQKQEGTK